MVVEADVGLVACVDLEEVVVVLVEGSVGLDVEVTASVVCSEDCVATVVCWDVVSVSSEDLLVGTDVDEDADVSSKGSAVCADVGAEEASDVCFFVVSG